MIIRQLNEKQFDHLQELLPYIAQKNPLDAEFNVKMTVNNQKYILKIQPTIKRKIAVLQALEVSKKADKKLYRTLIKDNKILLALFELMLFQGAI